MLTVCLVTRSLLAQACCTYASTRIAPRFVLGVVRRNLATAVVGSGEGSVQFSQLVQPPLFSSEQRNRVQQARRTGAPNWKLSWPFLQEELDIYTPSKHIFRFFQFGRRSDTYRHRLLPALIAYNTEVSWSAGSRGHRCVWSVEVLCAWVRPHEFFSCCGPLFVVRYAKKRALGQEFSPPRSRRRESPAGLARVVREAGAVLCAAQNIPSVAPLTQVRDTCYRHLLCMYLCSKMLGMPPPCQTEHEIRVYEAVPKSYILYIARRTIRRVLSYI